VFHANSLAGTVIAKAGLARFDRYAAMLSEKAKLLIIDDDAQMRDLLRDFLSRSYDCVTANSAEDALALTATESFDLILSDIMMARMNGLEMIPQILNLAPQAAVVMISGQRNIDFAIQSMRAGAFDFITKPFDLSEVDVVIRRALDNAKRRNHGANTIEERSIKRLRAAIDNNEFVVHYQPQLNIASRTMVGAEALVRWQDPEFGLLPPANFISLAEKTELIVPLGRWVLQTACAQARKWQQAGLAGFRVAINVSPKQLKEDELREHLCELLEENDLDPGCLDLELTETSIMQDPDSAIEILNGIRELGVKIAIDDFGTGYSSLGYLKDLPIDSVKLDRSFVQGATSDPDHAALVMAIIVLAHNLRFKVIAEGIETEDQLKFLRLLKCDEGQGYLLGRPAPAEQFNFGTNRFPMVDRVAAA
jgi:EAL domain-containing protein (putative c-di-GMP-specific phosphodiesterase class I)/AmiR/NasT family two-component response regulator